MARFIAAQRAQFGLVAAFTSRAQALLSQDRGQRLAGGGVERIVGDLRVHLSQAARCLEVEPCFVDEVCGFLGVRRHLLEMAMIDEFLNDVGAFRSAHCMSPGSAVVRFCGRSFTG